MVVVIVVVVVVIVVVVDDDDDDDDDDNDDDDVIVIALQNARARSLSAALSRFGELCHLIKASKCRCAIF